MDEVESVCAYMYQLDEAINVLKNYYNMINEEEYDANVLEELVVYDEVCKQPNRKNCVLLPSRAIKNMLDKLDKTTE